MRAMPGQGGHDCSEEGNPPAEEYGAAAPASEEVLGFVQALVVLAEDAELEYPGAEAPPDLITHGVAQDGRCDHRDQHTPQRHVTKFRGNAAKDRCCLPGENEPDEQGVFGEDDRCDDPDNRPSRNGQYVRHQALHGGVPSGDVVVDAWSWVS